MSEEPRKAVALDYSGSGAPKVVAAGRGHVATAITDRAAAAGVPIRRDPALTEALAQLDLETEIPEELYAAVAEALAWAYGLATQPR